MRVILVTAALLSPLSSISSQTGSSQADTGKCVPPGLAYSCVPSAYKPNVSLVWQYPTSPEYITNGGLWIIVEPKRTMFFWGLGAYQHPNSYCHLTSEFVKISDGEVTKYQGAPSQDFSGFELTTAPHDPVVNLRVNAYCKSLPILNTYNQVFVKVWMHVHLASDQYLKGEFLTGQLHEKMLGDVLLGLKGQLNVENKKEQWAVTEWTLNRKALGSPWSGVVTVWGALLGGTYNFSHSVQLSVGPTGTMVGSARGEAAIRGVQQNTSVSWSMTPVNMDGV